MTRSLLVVCVVGFAFAPASAADKKPAGLRDFPFWTGPKTPHARAFVPGLQAALNITPDQAEQIEAACRETIDKPEAKGKGAGGEAVEKVHKLVADILTAEQKKKIEKMNDLYAKVVTSVADDFQAEFAAAKGDDEKIKALREKVRAEQAAAFGRQLESILTADEMKAVATAAAEQKKRDEESAKKPKAK